MTLSTYLYVHGPVVIPELLAELRRNLALYDPEHRAPEQHIPLDQPLMDNGARWTGNRIGQDLPSMLLIEYGGDGPLRTPDDAAAHDEDCNVPGNEYFDPDQPACDGSDHDPAMHARVNWDTSYGWKDPQVGGCADLHARLIVHAGNWLDARRIDWSWRNKFTGEVHQRHDGLAEFIGNGDEARAWFTGTVLPAIAVQITRASS